MISVSIIIPAHNEESTIIPLLKAVNSAVFENSTVHFEIIVVNDSSTDSTLSLLEANTSLYSILISTPKKSGKGGAALAGLTKASGDFILFQDADLEYSPDEYVSLVRPIVDLDADVVIGSRFLAPKTTRVHYFWNKCGNKAITLTFNLLNNTTFTDIYSCYLLYRRSLFETTDLRYMGWEQHGEILTLAVRKGSRFFEVPISYYGRTYEEGKKIRGRDIIAIFFALLVTRFRSIR